MYNVLKFLGRFEVFKEPLFALSYVILWAAPAGRWPRRLGQGGPILQMEKQMSNRVSNVFEVLGVGKHG